MSVNGSIMFSLPPICIWLWLFTLWKIKLEQVGRSSKSFTFQNLVDQSNWHYEQTFLTAALEFFPPFSCYSVMLDSILMQFQANPKFPRMLTNAWKLFIELANSAPTFWSSGKYSNEVISQPDLNLELVGSHDKFCICIIFPARNCCQSYFMSVHTVTIKGSMNTNGTLPLAGPLVLAVWLPKPPHLCWTEGIFPRSNRGHRLAPAPSWRLVTAVNSRSSLTRCRPPSLVIRQLHLKRKRDL